jgi:nucleoside-diphosphate-sugar epimerase
MALPDNIESEEQLEQVLTTPSAALVEFIRTVTSPLLILGAGGKMGPTLAVLAKHAAEAAKHPLEVVAVSRFNEPTPRLWLETHHVKTLSADLTRSQYLLDLPDSDTVLYLVGQKFGTANNPAATWVTNTIVASRVAERFPQARIAALSTGNVYPLSEVSRGGSVESDVLTPLGEYANAAVGRERVFEFYSQTRKTRIALLRLFYAVELRYGVLVDIARKVHNGEAIELANGYFNCVWQGDANELTLRALELVSSPPSVWNLCRPEIYSVREVANWFGKRFGLSPQFAGVEAKTALLGNSSTLCAKLGAPSVTLERMLHWIGDWIAHGGRVLGKPTHFETRDGRY